MKYVVKSADMKISDKQGDELVTHALGSCLGIVVYDPRAAIGGLHHVMLPDSRINLEKARQRPFMFVDTGVPEFLKRICAAGAERRRLTVKVAGGARTGADVNGLFSIGMRNYHMLRKVFWRMGLLITAEDIGGCDARTVHLEIGSGRMWLTSKGRRWTL